MSIRFTCPNGHELNVKDKYAGKPGICPQCQARVLVPTPAEKLTDDAIVSRTAAGLTALFDELRQRGVNLVRLKDGLDLSTPAGRLMANVLADVAQYENEVRGERTVLGLSTLFDELKLRKVNLVSVREGIDLSTISGRQSHQLPPDQRPFELKGDRLGMPLQVFKNKYHRVVGGTVLPFCSDTNPDIDISALLYKARYAEAGIVHGRTTAPFEEYGLNLNFPTIAGVKADLFIYAFVDEKLYQMTILFSHDNYGHVMDAMQAKYGDPTQHFFRAKSDGNVANWSNAVSEIFFFEGNGTRRGRRCTVLVTHKELAKLARGRIEADRQAHLRDDL